MDIIINGYSGKMGQTLEKLILASDDMNLVARIDRNGGESPNGESIYKSIRDYSGAGDVIIDFSTPSALDDLLSYAKKNKTPLVLATTGYKDSDLKKIADASRELKIFQSANMSLGINLLLDLVEKASQVLTNFDIEIIEKHHNKKIDAPSGTAYMIADRINNVFGNEKLYTFGRSSSKQRRSEKEIGIHAVRGGTIVGEHNVIFAGNDEVLEIKHTAQSKSVFAEGALAAARFLMTVDEGLYNMDDLIASI